MNKFYIYRNHTVEHLFKGFDVSYSGYDDILSDPLDANWLVWFYMPKIVGSNDVLQEEVETYFQRLQLLLNNNADKKILVFLLSARMLKQFSHNDTHLEEAITRFNQKVISDKTKIAGINYVAMEFKRTGVI